MGYLRLRQIALVAKDLATVEKQIADVLGLEICYRDPGVGKYGLHNALFAMSGTFLEVVSPTQPTTRRAAAISSGARAMAATCTSSTATTSNGGASISRRWACGWCRTCKSGDDVSTSEALHLHPQGHGRMPAVGRSAFGRRGHDGRLSLGRAELAGEGSLEDGAGDHRRAHAVR